MLRGLLCAELDLLKAWLFYALTSLKVLETDFQAVVYMAFI
jgi:hypothetical protein